MVATRDLPFRLFLGRRDDKGPVRVRWIFGWYSSSKKSDKHFSILSSMEPPKGIKFGLDSSNINSTSCKSSSIEFEFWLDSNRLGEGVCLDSPSESIRAFSSEVIIYPGLSGELSSSICGSSGSWFIPGSGSRFACEENWNLMRESFS